MLQSLFECLPKDSFNFAAPEEIDSCELAFLRFSSVVIDKGHSSPIPLPEGSEILVLERHNDYWVVPRTSKTSKVQGNLQYLLARLPSGAYLCMLPLLDGNIQAHLNGGESGFVVSARGLAPEQNPHDATLLLASTGNDPYKLMEVTLQKLELHYPNFRLRKRENDPAFADKLGWCTWNALGLDVTEEKVLNGVNSFKEGDIPLRCLILDDGWQDTDGNYLISFNCNGERFPSGLSGLSHSLKEAGIEIFGVWHALEGYWLGLKVGSELEQKYPTIKEWKKKIHWDGLPHEVVMVAPEKINEFYDEFYRVLKEQGVDMVKVDNQSMLATFADGVTGLGNMAMNYQKALQNNCNKYFNNNLIWCMANGTEVAYNLFQAGAYRNSDDYFPDGSISHSWHLHVNALNNMWTGFFSLPDWDMFETHHKNGELHAVARAISGGPVYVTDTPGKQNFEILKKMVMQNGIVPRFDSPCLPCPDMLFKETVSAHNPLKVFNRNKAAGLSVLGVFNICENQPREMNCRVQAGDIPEAPSGNLVVWKMKEQCATKIKSDEILEFVLPFMGWEMFIFVQIAPTATPLGLVDKYAGAAAIKSVERNDNRVDCDFSGPGRAAVYCEAAPTTVRFNDADADFSFDGNMLFVDLNQAGRLSLSF